MFNWKNPALSEVDPKVTVITLVELVHVTEPKAAGSINVHAKVEDVETLIKSGSVSTSLPDAGTSVAKVDNNDRVESDLIVLGLTSTLVPVSVAAFHKFGINNIIEIIII